MSQGSTPLSAVLPAPSFSSAPPHIKGGFKAWTELFKVRLNALVLLTTGVGFYLAAEQPDWAAFGWTMLGTALTAFAASGINQFMEIERDACMPRTMKRPLPAKLISRSAALSAAVSLAVLGPLVLALLVNWLAAGLALSCLLLYVFIYTPLKTRTSLNTLVGAVVGAVPPLVGWAGAAGRLELGAAVLGGILFIWQIPHFLALAWMYREQYAKGGFRMLPHSDATGLKTCQAILIYSMALLPVSLLLAGAGVVGLRYAVGALVLGAVMLAFAFQMYGACERTTARRLFLCSVIYLPLLLALMVLDRTPSSRYRFELFRAPPGARFPDNRPVTEPAPSAGPNSDTSSASQDTAR